MSVRLAPEETIQPVASLLSAGRRCCVERDCSRLLVAIALILACSVSAGADGPSLARLARTRVNAAGAAGHVPRHVREEARGRKSGEAVDRQSSHGEDIAFVSTDSKFRDAGVLPTDGLGNWPWISSLILAASALGLVVLYRRLLAGTHAGAFGPGALTCIGTLRLRPGVDLHLIQATDQDVMVAADQRGIQSVVLLRTRFPLDAEEPNEAVAGMDVDPFSDTSHFVRRDASCSDPSLAALAPIRSRLSTLEPQS